MLDFLKKMLPSQKSDTPSGVVDKVDIAKFIRDGAIVGAIAALGWYGAHLNQVLTFLGDIAIPAAALLGSGISYVIRLLKDNGPKE